MLTKSRLTFSHLHPLMWYFYNYWFEVCFKIYMCMYHCNSATHFNHTSISYSLGTYNGIQQTVLEMNLQLSQNWYKNVFPLISSLEHTLFRNWFGTFSVNCSFLCHNYLHLTCVRAFQIFQIEYAVIVSVWVNKNTEPFPHKNGCIVL